MNDLRRQRLFSLAAFVLSGALLLSAQNRLQPSEAKAHIGERATVCGALLSATVEALDPDRSLLKVGSPDFTVIVMTQLYLTQLYEKERQLRLLGETLICVTGQIQEYQGGAAIIVTDPSRITVELVLVPPSKGPPPPPPPAAKTFDWPPPQWTSRTEVPVTLVRPDAKATYGQVFKRITEALKRADFSDWSVYKITSPAEGFVVVARMEHVDENGKPLPDRFVTEPGSSRAGFLLRLLEAVFNAPAGRYRVITIVLTAEQVVANTARKPDEIKNLVSGGPDVLPRDMRESVPPTDSRCVALIYEFAREVGRAAVWVKPESSNIDPRQHLVLAGLWTREKL